MPQLNTAVYRRDYKGEPLTYDEGDQLISLFVNPRQFPYDRNVSTAIVLGNGISRLQPDIQLLLNQNNKRVAEGYKTTYACNAAYRDTKADYYIFKDNLFFAEKYQMDYSRIFLPNNYWINYRDCNLIPYFWYMDSGSTAAYMAAFDGAKKIFLFGFDGSDGETNLNVYQNSLAYHNNDHNHETHHAYLYNICRVYNSTQFYRVRTEHSFDVSKELYDLPNYHEVSIRGAVLAGDF